MPLIRTHGFSQRVMNNPNYLNYPKCYAVCDRTAVKIGHSLNNPVLRMSSLSTGNPRVLTLIAYTTHATERTMHHHLRHHHLRGEWFKLCLPLLAELNTWDWLDIKVYNKLLRTLA